MTYILLFRGINVGGKNLIKMADLRSFFSKLNFTQVKTYIQSGNVVFDSALSKSAISSLIRPAFLETFGFPADFCLLTGAELQEIISALPFSKEDIQTITALDEQVAHLYVYFPIDRLEKLALPIQIIPTPFEQLGGNTLALYLLTEPSIRNSKLAKELAKMPIQFTARNWRSVLKIAELSGV